MGYLTDNIFMPKETVILRANQMTASETHFKLQFKDHSKMEHYPGQIVEASVNGFGEIPLGVSSDTREDGTFDLVVRKVGRVSSALVGLKEGDSMFVRGPLGNGFPIKDLYEHPILVVAGGIGLCPTRSLIEHILNHRTQFKDFKLFFGAKCPSDLLFQDDLAKWEKSSDVDFKLTVDKPDETWKKNVGVITTLFKTTQVDPDSRVVICGPPIMYKFVVQELNKIGVPHHHIYVDLERRMKCGIGKCGHCQMNDKYVCTDGPVFRYSEVEQLEEAF